ncbi:hypothetical protein JHK87_012096 [Glycine soja]|nr:hypothetical protein JHK87_012096 [Glycine soja]
MGKRKERIQNPEPFDPYGADPAKTKKRSKAPKRHQQEEQFIAPKLSSKIMKQALIQQKEEEKEEAPENNAANLFEEVPDVEEDGGDDIDDFAGFSETQSQFAEYDEEINEEDERLMEAFALKEPGQQKTLADLIVQRIKEKDALLGGFILTLVFVIFLCPENRPVPKLDNSIIDIYKGVGTHLSRYTIGKIPKAFKHIPSMQLWEEVLYITEPENWSPNALYQATRIFASNFGAKKAERFYKLVLLPRVREDIRKNKRLHFALYQTLKKALYKPAAFFKGILFSLCESRTCTLREAVIIGSIIEKVSIPPLHSSVALLKLSGMEYCGTTSYFIKLLLEKKYALPYRVVDAVVAHFTRFLNETRIMPVIWHQSLLAFVQRPLAYTQLVGSLSLEACSPNELTSAKQTSFLNLFHCQYCFGFTKVTEIHFKPCSQISSRSLAANGVLKLLMFTWEVLVHSQPCWHWGCRVWWDVTIVGSSCKIWGLESHIGNVGFWCGVYKALGSPSTTASFCGGVLPRYKNELQKEDKDRLRNLLEKQKHKLVTPEISRELDHSRNRGEKEEDLMSIYILSILTYLYPTYPHFLNESECPILWLVALVNSTQYFCSNVEWPWATAVFIYEHNLLSHYIGYGIGRSLLSEIDNYSRIFHRYSLGREKMFRDMSSFSFTRVQF